MRSKFLFDVYGDVWVWLEVRSYENFRGIWFKVIAFRWTLLCSGKETDVYGDVVNGDFESSEVSWLCRGFC